MIELKFLFGIFLCFTFIVLAVGSDDRVYSAVESGCEVVKTKLGLISGVRLRTIWGGNSFCGYRGIRFGQPPVGDLRFKVWITLWLMKMWRKKLQNSESSRNFKMKIFPKSGTCCGWRMGRHLKCDWLRSELHPNIFRRCGVFAVGRLPISKCIRSQCFGVQVENEQNSGHCLYLWRCFYQRRKWW